jgi:dipeptidyl aminopeptidase/acylaminoacyl peptidase
MRQALVFAMIAVLSGPLSGAQKQTVASHTETFKSPDGMLVAVVRSKRAPEATDESRIELRTQNGVVSAKRDYTSEDGEHGYGVTKAAWTPDSQFFVYSLESSGGHQAWKSPVWFFSRKENKFLSLDHALNDAVANPEFHVSAPDRVTVELYFSKHTRTVALQQLR